MEKVSSAWFMSTELAAPHIQVTNPCRTVGRWILSCSKKRALFTNPLLAPRPYLLQCAAAIPNLIPCLFRAPTGDGVEWMPISVLIVVRADTHARPARNMNSELERKLSAASATGASIRTQQQLLKYLKDKGFRRPDLEVKFGYELISKHKSALKQEVWSVYETVYLAALDLHDSQLAQSCLSALQTNFPKSVRVQLLEARGYEAEEKYSKAQKIYDAILKDDPANAAARKGNVCLQKARGNTTEAIKLLVEYLEVFTSDTEAWQELTDLYIACCKFELAKFCAEELVLLQPELWVHHCLYAEILYQLGGKENLEQAMDYFAQSLELRPKANLRALYGLAMTIRTLGRPSQGSLYREVQSKLDSLYSAYPELQALVRDSFKEVAATDADKNQGKVLSNSLPSADTGAGAPGDEHEDRPPEQRDEEGEEEGDEDEEEEEEIGGHEYEEGNEVLVEGGRRRKSGSRKGKRDGAADRQNRQSECQAAWNFKCPASLQLDSVEFSSLKSLLTAAAINREPTQLSAGQRYDSESQMTSARRKAVKSGLEVTHDP
eukprot:g75771.t1